MKMRWIILVGLVVVGVAGLVRVLDWGYARGVEWRYEKWNASIERDAQGVRLDYMEIERGMTPERGKAVLFVHGFASPPALYDRFLPMFDEAGYACRAIRLPGFGETIVSAREVTHEDWLRKIDQEIRALRAQYPEVWIVAHSLGAASSVAAISAYDLDVDGLVMLAPLLEVSDKRSPLLPPRRWFDIGTRSMRHITMLETAFPIHSDDPALRNLPGRDLFLPLSIFEAVFEMTDLAQRAELPEGMPLFMATADTDRVVDSEAAAAWFDARAREGDQRVTRHPAGHLLPLDTGWDSLARDVLDFMQARDTDGPAYGFTDTQE
jgi:alpha-beta hydrolase superfamily lysophospholipase